VDDFHYGLFGDPIPTIIGYGVYSMLVVMMMMMMMMMMMNMKNTDDKDV